MPAPAASMGNITFSRAEAPAPMSFDLRLAPLFVASGNPPVPRVRHDKTSCRGLLRGVILTRASTSRRGDRTDESSRRNFLAQVIGACGAFLAALLGIPALGAVVVPTLKRDESAWL